MSSVGVLLDGPVQQLADAVRSGEVSATQIAQASIDRCIELSKTTNAMHTVHTERVLQEAGELDRRVRAGHDPGPLAGVPVAIKDNILVQDRLTTCGSAILEGYVAPYNAHAIDRLRLAGAVPVGRANMDEFAMGGSTETCAWGRVANPWDLSRVPGGSSGGSAALVAGGAVPLALGSDTGGSVRQPASFTGLVGIKPTYGHVSRRGLVAFASSTDQISPLGRSVADTALLLDSIVGRDPLDATSIEAANPCLPSVGQTVSGLRIGVPKEYFDEGTHPAVVQAVESALHALEQRGAVIVEVSLPSTALAVACYYVLAPAEASANLARFDGVRYGRRAQGESIHQIYRRSRTEGLGAEVKRRILIGTFALSAGYVDAYYHQAQRVRGQLTDELNAALGHVDALITPTAPTVAYPFGGRSDPVSMYLGDVLTIPASLAGIPAVSVPVGIHHGHPIGAQVMTAAGMDPRALQIAYALEQHTEPLGRPPTWVGEGDTSP